MKTASFYTTAHKMILAILRANRDGLRVYDTHGWRALTDEELQRLDHAKASDVSCEGDLYDFDMFDGCWRGLRTARTARQRILHIRHAHRVRRQDRMGDGMRRTRPVRQGMKRNHHERERNLRRFNPRSIRAG